MYRTLTPLAALAMLGLVGGAGAQDAAQTGPGTGNGGNVESLSCADLNEMDPADGISFLRGYQYGLTAAGRSEAGSATTAESAGNAPAVGPGNATTTGDVQSSGLTVEEAAGAGGTAEGTPFDSEAILASCYDAPGKPLDEILSGAFGVVN